MAKEKDSVLDELSKKSNFAQNTQREQVTALDNPSNKSSNLDKLLMEEAVEKQLDEVQHAQPVTKTQESISPASRAIAPSPAAPEPAAVTMAQEEAIAPSPAPAATEPAAVTKPEDSEDVEEAIAPSRAPCENAPADITIVQVADVALETSPLLQKTSVAVTESTHQFEAGDRSDNTLGQDAPESAQQKYLTRLVLPESVD